MGSDALAVGASWDTQACRMLWGCRMPKPHSRRTEKGHICHREEKSDKGTIDM